MLNFNFRLKDINWTLLRRIFPGLLLTMAILYFFKFYNKSEQNIQILLNITEQKIKPKCNFDYLREYFVKTGEYHSQGNWSEDAWNPHGCILSKPDKTEQMRYIERNNVTSILVIGDSTAYRYHDAIQIQLDGIYGRLKCKVEKMEHFSESNPYLPDRQYFADIPDILTKERGCSGCHSHTYSCNTSKSSHKITAEYLSMDYFMDSSVTTLREVRTKTCKQNLAQFKSWKVGCGSSATTQEFIFNEYLPLKTSTPYPDLIILIANFHDIKRHNVNSFKRTLTWFMDVVNQSTIEHPGTKIVWFQPTYIATQNQPVQYHNMTSQARIYELYENGKEILGKYFKDTSGRFLPFYSLQDISKGVPHLNVDGIHYKKYFYLKIIELFFQTLAT